jgi:uncharacterized protein (DUF1501 family)
VTRSIDRRLFLQSGFAALGSSVLVTQSPFALASTARRLDDRRLPFDNGRRLVVVQLRGGNDGLNTVVPYTDGAYYAMRPSLAVTSGDVLPVDQTSGFHPAFAPLLPWWQTGRMAVVQGAGYPGPDLSHFRSEAIWYTADPMVATTDGWLGRWHAALASPSPVGLTTVGALPSPGLTAVGYVPAAIQDPDSFGFDLVSPIPQDSALRRQLLRDGFTHGAAGGDLLAEVAGTGLAADAIVDLVATVPPEDVPPVSYPATALGADLTTAARLLAADLGTRVVWVTTGGFDTHADQDDTHTALLSDVASSVAAFLTDLEARDLSSRTAVLIWSEFGRRPQENGSLGTDHGAAAPAFLLGDPVAGGMIGAQPDLTSLDWGGNPRFDIDFRSIYETVLAEHLGVDPRMVFSEPFERLGVFR